MCRLLIQHKSLLMYYCVHTGGQQCKDVSTLYLFMEAGLDPRENNRWQMYSVVAKVTVPRAWSPHLKTQLAVYRYWYGLQYHRSQPTPVCVVSCMIQCLIHQTWWDILFSIYNKGDQSSCPSQSRPLGQQSCHLQIGLSHTTVHTFVPTYRDAELCTMFPYLLQFVRDWSTEFEPYTFPRTVAKFTPLIER